MPSKSIKLKTQTDCDNLKQYQVLECPSKKQYLHECLSLVLRLISLNYYEFELTNINILVVDGKVMLLNQQLQLLYQKDY